MLPTVSLVSRVLLKLCTDDLPWKLIGGPLVKRGSRDLVLRPDGGVTVGTGVLQPDPEGSQPLIPQFPQQ